MSSLLGAGGLGGDAGGSVADGALSLEDVLSLLADCEDGAEAAPASGPRQGVGGGSSPGTPGFHDVDFGGLHFGWPPTPPGSDGELPVYDPQERFEGAYADLVAVEEAAMGADRSTAAAEPMSDDVDSSPSPVSTPPVGSSAPHEELHMTPTAVAAAASAAVAATSSAAASDGAAKRKPKKKKAGYNSNKARDQRKEELLYLRKRVDQMETYLRKLKETAARNDSISSSSGSRNGALRGALVCQSPAAAASVGRSTAAREDASTLRLAEVGPVWEDIAARQYKERRRAEMENIRLKLVLESQLKMAKSLEKVLNKRYNERVVESIRGKQRVKRVDRPIVPDDDAPIFRELLAGLENALEEVDQDFEANGLARMVKPYHDAQLRRDASDGGVVMEIFANKMMPFDVASTGQAVWEHFAHSMERLPSRFVYEKQLKNLAETDDLIVESFRLELVGSRNNKADLHVRQILRKFVEPERVVIAWRVYCEPIEVSTERTDGIRLLEKGYTVIKRVRDDVDSHSLVQTCYIIRPEAYGTIVDQERKVGAITDFLLDSVTRTISASHQMIENVMLDRALFPAPPTSA